MPYSSSSPVIDKYFNIIKIINPDYFSDNSSNVKSSRTKSVVKKDDRNRARKSCVNGATKPDNKVIRAN